MWESHARRRWAVNRWQEHRPHYEQHHTASSHYQRRCGRQLCAGPLLPHHCDWDCHSSGRWHINLNQHCFTRYHSLPLQGVSNSVWLCASVGEECEVAWWSNLIEQYIQKDKRPLFYCECMHRCLSDASLLVSTAGVAMQTFLNGRMRSRYCY